MRAAIMAGIPAALLKLVISGTLANGVQGFSNSLWMNSPLPQPASQADLVALHTSIDPLVQTFVAASGMHNIRTAADAYTGSTLYNYPVSSPVSSLVSDLPFATALPGDGTGTLPKETCLVMSLRSDLTGRSGRGRIYIPATGIGLTTAGVVASSSVIDAAATAFKVFADGLSALTAPVVVASFTKGRASLVERVVVDNKPDTQRRRQDKINASYAKTLDL